jgi:hypothetical protein|tara:strand:+ start:67 stop:231 length:165 start_codon:yes stop_codon:yes gene_type:complete
VAAVLKRCIALSRRRTKEKLAEQRHSADVGRRVRAELKRIEAQLINAGLIPDDG